MNVKVCGGVFQLQVLILYLNSMEKSMVQELSVLTHSTVFSSRPSFLLSDADRPELRRSRIQNLPGYRKEDLSAKLNFVVVFQTIEIQRLTQEAQGLRVMVRDAERQRLNFSNYQVQIRELTERCHAYEMQEDDRQLEMRRLRQFCDRLVRELQATRLQEGLKEKYQAERERAQQLQAEVERWRMRLSALELSRSKELEEVRLQLQSRRRSQLSRETRQLTIKHENELSALSADLRKAREEAQMRLTEVNRLQELVSKLQLREAEIQQVQDKMYEYENRFVLLSQENYRLNQLLRKRAEELDRLRNIQKQLRVRVEGGRGLQQQSARLQSQLQSKQRAIVELQKKLRFSSQASEKLSQQSQKTKQYEQLVGQLSNELERINQIMRDKVNESEALRNGQRLLEGKLAASSAATQRQFATYEQKLVSYTKQQERLSAQLRYRLAQNEQMKTRISELEKAGSNSLALREENEGLRGQLGQYNNKIDEFNRKIRLLEENLRLMEDLERKLQVQEYSKRELAADRDRLNALLRQSTLRAETAIQKAQAAEEAIKRASGAESELRELKQKSAWMTQQLDRLSAQIIRRIAELQQLKENVRVLSNSKASYQGIEQRLVTNLAQMEQMVLELDRTKRENDRLHNDNMNLEGQIRSLQGQVLELADERQEQNRLAASQASELQQLRVKVEQASGEARVRVQLEQTVQEQQKKLENFKAMYSQLEDRLKKETAQSEAMVFELMQIRSQPRVSKELADELQTLRRQAEDQQRTITILYNRLDTIQAILRSVKQNYTVQFQELIGLRERLALLAKQAQVIDSMQILLEGYIGKVDDLREQNLRLESEKVLAGMQGIQYCESQRILQEPSVEVPHPSVKNSSIAYRVPAQEARGDQDGYVFTFKEVHRQHSLTAHDRINQQTEEESSGRRSPEESSMASSFINTLITKESSARFDQRPQQIQNTGFGVNPNPSSKLRYFPAGQEMRYCEQYLQIERDIQNLPTQINRAGSPVNQRMGGYFENAGIKRVTSYTHFAPNLIQCPGSPSYLHGQSRDSSQGHRAQLLSSPSQDTMNSANDSSQLGRRIRIPADPARLLLYRQH